jgi:type VI secretion system protein ImpG
VDQHGVMMQANAEILGVKCICTNHNLPSMIPVGSVEGDFYLPGAPGGTRIQALHRPTQSYAAQFREGQTWNLISLLSLNHLSLGEAGLGALQEILRLHDFTRSPQLEKQISGITNLQAQRHVAVMQGEFGSAAIKGIRVEIGLDESHFPDGTAYLFSAVLDRFLGLYVSMNSFSQLVVRSEARKEVLGEWPPRAGTQALL